MKRRVFHIISHFDVGGAERVAANIAMSRNAAFEYHVVEVMRGRSAFSRRFIAELEAAGVRCHRSLVPDIRFHYVVERIAALLFPLRFLIMWLRWRPDVVHSHTETPDLATYAAFKALPFVGKRCMIVRTIHNTRLWTGQAKMGRRVERFFIARNANVAISQAVAETYANIYGVRPMKIIYNGMPETPQEPYPHLRKGKVNILFAARFEEQKGICTLVEIVRRMAGDERYFFHIHGSGGMEGYVSSSLRGARNAVVGKPIFNVARYMTSFDYMIMPSLHEGLALMPIEASLAGLPTIINHCEGLYETLPPDWRLTIYNNKVDDYVDLLANALPSLDRGKLSAEAKAFALQHFSLERMRRDYESHIVGALLDVE